MTERKRRGGGRRLLLLGALAAFAVAMFASAPAANAGLVGANALTINIGGTGAGHVVQSSGPNNATPLAINCNKAAGNGQPSTGVCTTNVPFGEPPQAWVGVTALPPAGSQFAGWTVPAGAPVAVGNYCGLSPTCIVQMNDAVTLQALFTTAPGAPLLVFRAGSAASQGSVVSNPAGINCTPSDQIDCTDQFAIGSTVTLTALPPSGVTFGGWSTQGTSAPLACVGGNAGPTCSFVVPSAPLYIVATFNTQTFPLTVSVTGDGGVSSNIQPNGINCGSGNTACTLNVGSGQQVSLTAQADTGYNFDGWGGACATSSGPLCVVTMNQAQSVSAAFVAAEVQASVTGNRMIYNNRNPRRVLRVTVNAQQDVQVRVQLRRNGRNYASKRFRNVDDGVTNLFMNIRNAVPAGRYTAVVTITNNLGAEPLVQNRNVRLKAARR